MKIAIQLKEQRCRLFFFCICLKCEKDFLFIIFVKKRLTYSDRLILVLKQQVKFYFQNVGCFYVSKFISFLTFFGYSLDKSLIQLDTPCREQTMTKLESTFFYTVSQFQKTDKAIQAIYENSKTQWLKGTNMVHSRALRVKTLKMINYPLKIISWNNTIFST